ncbi:MAG: aminotransferase [Planctomycetota bacterium]|nr:MAG: aminotransferase [Planctomycetota bacterium]
MQSMSFTEPIAQVIEKRMQTDRRMFLRTLTGATAAYTLPSLIDDWPSIIHRANASQPVEGDNPRNGKTIPGRDQPSSMDDKNDESFWFNVQQAFSIDRSYINLNNGGVCPSPRVVMDAQRRQLEFTNNAPARHLWQVQDPQLELVRAKLARLYGCDPEEMAITRNASEALQISLNGIDLKPGDEILTSTHDYPRMIATIRQREKREGVVMKQVPLPPPDASQDEVVGAFERGITSKTRILLVSHVVFLTGRILPVQDICAMARKRGLIIIVDGAHAFGQIAYDGREIDCDMYGVSCHKWLTAPIGTGFLHVRRGMIKDLWPLTAPEDPKSENIRKFEEIGTHPDAGRLAIGEAIAFHLGIGPKRKEHRLRTLRNYWATRLMKHQKVKLFTNLAPDRSCAIGTIGIDGIEPLALTSHLWDKHKIIVTPIDHEDIHGVRVTANVYTTFDELDLFCEAMENVAREGLPKNGK